MSSKVGLSVPVIGDLFTLGGEVGSTAAASSNGTPVGKAFSGAMAWGTGSVRKLSGLLGSGGAGGLCISVGCW